jgi:N-acetylneuraminic acid mutarotase
MSGIAAVANRGNNIIVGGDAYLDYYYPLTYPLSVAATNSYWTYLPQYYGLNIAGGAIVSDGKIVIYGGTDGTTSQNVTIAYDPTGDTLPALPNMLAARSYLGYASDRNGNAYAFGGLDDSGNALASAERLNPTANTPAWTYIASLPGPRYNFPAVFNRTNYIYIFGGQTDPATGEETTSVLRYSVSGNSWSNMASMPVAVAGSAATLGPDGNVYVAGGTSGGVSTDVVQVYNPAANSWSISTPLPQGLSLAAMGVDSLNRLIVVGGVDDTGNDVADVWRSQQFGLPDNPPAITQVPATNGIYLAAYGSSITATGSPPPTYSLVSGPAGLQVDYYTGAITWTPQGLGQIGLFPVTVQAANYAGATNYSFSINVPNPPPATPSNLTVVSVTEDSVTLSWSPVDPTAGALTYSVSLRHVLHDPKGSGATVWYTQIGSSTTGKTLTISGLAAGLSQSYYLKAVGPGGTSGYAAVGAATLPAPPPTNLRVTDLTSTSISLAWDAPVGGFPTVSYEVLGWYNGVAQQYPLAIVNIPGTSITLTGLASGTAMLWGVSARDTMGNVTAYDYLPNLVANPPRQAAALTAAGLAQAPGAFQFTVQAGAMRTTLIQATTNPGDPSSWVTIATNPPTADNFIFTDPNAGQFPARFYRVVSP